ncbi:hypothetical protein EAE96_008709 [Botrytis aclada]|nr:hypothetical protein EAE96_008709 [Botrytis aclada]
MSDLIISHSFPLLKGSIDLLLLLPHYLDNIEDFIHLSSSCKTLHNIFNEYPPSPGLLFELAAASSLEIFEPKPHFLMAGAARQVGQWIVATPEDCVEFHESFKVEGIYGLFELFKRAKLTLEEISGLIKFKKSILEPLDLCLKIRRGEIPPVSIGHSVQPCLQIAMFGDLFAASVRSSYEPGVMNPLHTNIRLDWWVKCCPDGFCKYNESLRDGFWSDHLPDNRYQMCKVSGVLLYAIFPKKTTLISWTKQMPEYFDISLEGLTTIFEDPSFHDRHLAFRALVFLQGLKSMELIYQLAIGMPSPNACIALNSAMVAFRMDSSLVSKFRVVEDNMGERGCLDLDGVVDILIDVCFNWGLSLKKLHWW